jgi:two-component system OmpR family response regulator
MDNSQVLLDKNRGKIVMGVDDVPINLTILGAYIQKAGFTFIGAASGEECLNLTTRVQPRVLLLDIQLPGIDGFEVCRRLRRREEFTRVPIVFLTASDNLEDVKEGMAAGGNDFITKPVQQAKLIERVTYWVQRRVGA